MTDIVHTCQFPLVKSKFRILPNHTSGNSLKYFCINFGRQKAFIFVTEDVINT